MIVPFAQCAGFAGSAFNEMQTIWHDTHNQWATVFSEALREVMDRVTSPNLHTEQGSIDLERALKWKFLVPILFLQKPPSFHGIKASSLKPIFVCNMHMAICMV